MKPNVSLNMFGTHAFPCQYIFIPQVGQGYFNIQTFFQAKIVAYKMDEAQL
jgi:hypothetical protein